MQEYAFDIVYCKGSENTNADFLSHNPILNIHTTALTTTTTQPLIKEIQEA